MKEEKTKLFINFLLIINGILESLSTSTIIPFLTLLVSDNDFIDLGIINKLSINNSNQLLLNLTILFCIFIFFSTSLRIFNNWYILQLTAKIDTDLSNSIFRNNIYQSYFDYTKEFI